MLGAARPKVIQSARAEWGTPLQSGAGALAEALLCWLHRRDQRNNVKSKVRELLRAEEQDDQELSEDEDARAGEWESPTQRRGRGGGGEAASAGRLGNPIAGGEEAEEEEEAQTAGGAEGKEGVAIGRQQGGQRHEGSGVERQEILDASARTPSL